MISVLMIWLKAFGGFDDFAQGNMHKMQSPRPQQ